jgi:ABC-type lipoprotein release transport system permease subunit
VENVSPRIETFAMVSFGSVSKGIAVVGVSPEKEAQKSNLPSRLVRGEYLLETDDGILIGEGLSKYLKASIGDTLALIGQGYHGASAAQLFIVRGTLNMMTPEMDYAIAYITLSAAQQFIDMPNGYSGILISIKDNKLLNKTMEGISCQLSDSSNEKTENYELKTDNYEVYSWHFTMERLLQSSKSDKAFSIVLIYILYIIVGFGILGTIIMMTNERRREFCMMISLGMSRIRLVAVVSIELIIMSLIGVILAFSVTLPITYWFTAHPIPITGEIADTFLQFGMEPVLPMSTQPVIFINQMIIIFVISLLAVIYPANKILKLKITGN